MALQVIEHQLTALSDVGSVERGDALPDKDQRLPGTHHVRRARDRRSESQARRGRVAALPVSGSQRVEPALSAVRAGVDRLQRVVHEVQVRLYVVEAVDP